uniref:CUB domain-containing protein n=1 Tax=Haemonchus contortus TaxID=6289 RepID=A0A7I5EB92_HAECO|nr:CUB and Low density lipoprotein-receptor domain containing protein [Haemonchus contortus]
MVSGALTIAITCCCILGIAAIVAVEPSISFFDGNDPFNQCKTRIERRITGFSGVIYSHSLYGREPYNASRNCFMMLIAPLGYRIRLKIIEFDVNGNNSSCEKDTLHVFDHETSIDPSTVPSKSSATTTPGPIIGQFCGRRNNVTDLSLSTMNALTLWWHTDAILPQQHPAKGFQLHWNAFRVTAGVPCSAGREFACGHDQCIPVQLACDRFSDCPDGSDIIYSKQFAANCEDLDTDPLISVSGAFVLLLSAAVVLILGCLCISFCICCRCLKPVPQIKDESLNYAGGTSAPDPHQFCPPTPPKLPLPPTAPAFTPRKQVGINIPHDAYGPARFVDGFGGPTDHNDYAYVRNDVHRNLL